MKLLNPRTLVTAAALCASPAFAAEVCTVLADADTGKVLSQRGDCTRRVTPASTFKIAISLMGYDSGFLKDQHTPMLPFKPGYVDWRDSWKSPTDPAKWMKESVVWYSQQVTRSLGKQRFARYVRQFGYGNMNVAGDRQHDGLTLAWIDSSLRISSLEQVAFLSRMHRQQLGVSKQATAMTAALTDYGPVGPGWQMHGKTGAAGGYGWYVGWVERGPARLVFARLMQVDDSLPEELTPGVWAREGFIRDFAGLIDRLAK